MLTMRTILHSPLVLPPLLTMSVYVKYMVVIGRLSSHIMGPLAPAFHLMSLIMLSAAFAWHFRRGRQAQNALVAIPSAMFVGLVFGYISGLLSYVIVVCIWQFDRFQHGYFAKPLPLFLMWLGALGVMLASWLPGGLAGIAICLTLRFMQMGEPASRAS